MLPKPKYAFHFIVWVVLVTSLLVNFFLLGGYAWLQRSFSPVEEGQTALDLSGQTNEPNYPAPSALTALLNPNSDQSIIIKVNKIDSNYASGTITNVSQGNRWWAYQTEKGWKIAWSGQNDPSCKAMQDFGFPKDFYPNGCSENY